MMTVPACEQRRSYDVFFGIFPVVMPKHFRATLRALLAGVSGIYPCSYDSTFPCLVFGIFVDPPFEPVSPLGVAALGVSAFIRLQVTQMLKNNGRCSVLLGKLYNSAGDSMCFVLLNVLDFGPHFRIILDSFRQQSAKLGPLDPYFPQKTLPTVLEKIPAFDKFTSNLRTVAFENCAYGLPIPQVEIN